MRLLTAMVAAGLFLGLVSSSDATPYWSPEKIRAMEQGRDSLVPSGSQDLLTWHPKAYDYLQEFGQVAGFITSLQVMDPGDPDYGGLREAEHMLDVIQTDNTSELIWVLSRYRELTGDTQYDANVAAAWVYVMNFPAYDEEGGDANTTGYYRIYNCGWALRAETKYREIYGDSTYISYGDSCAGYLVTHNLIQGEDNFSRIVNPCVLSWASGNLHAYGVERDNATYREYGMLRGKRVKRFADTDSTLLGEQRWAMSGGSILWGVANSYYQEYPESIQIWTGAMAPFMDAYADSGAFTNAWNGWYALGHLAAGQILSDQGYLDNHHALADTLLFEDGDDDGGIPATPADADTMDHAWVANYVAYMALDALITTTDVVIATPVPRPEVLLEGNWPNPFNPNTNIVFALPSAGHVTLRVFDTRGRLVTTLLDGSRPQGRSMVPWDGTDRNGHLASPGVYFYRLRYGDAVPSRKMVLVK